MKRRRSATVCSSAAIPGRAPPGSLPRSSICARNCPGCAGSQAIPLLDLVAPTPELLAASRDDDRAGASGGSCAGVLRPRLWAQRGCGGRLAGVDGARNKRRGGGRPDSPRPTSGRPRSRRVGGGGAGGAPCMNGGADAAEQDLAAAAAALLDQGQRADRLSRPITAASASCCCCCRRFWGRRRCC